MNRIVGGRLRKGREGMDKRSMIDSSLALLNREGHALSLVCIDSSRTVLYIYHSCSPY